LILYILENYFDQYSVLKAAFDDSKKYSLDDGMLILRKKNDIDSHQSACIV